MKTVSQFLILLIFFLSWSCSDDEANNPGTVSIAPKVSFLQTDSTVNEGDEFEFFERFDVAFAAERGDHPMSSWSLRLNDSVYAERENLVSDSDKFTQLVRDIPVPRDSGRYYFSIVVRDNSGKRGETVFSIKVLPDGINDTSKGPIVFLVPSDSTVSGDTSVNVGQEIGIIVSVIMGNSDLDTWSIFRDGIALADYDQIDVPSPSDFTMPVFPIRVPFNEGNYTHTFEVTDKAGLKGSVSWLVKTELSPTFTELSNVILGAQQSSTFGSFFDVWRATVLFLSEANASDGQEVDFFFYNETSDGPTLYSPVDLNSGSFFGGTIGNWQFRNATKMQKSSLNFDNATVEEVLSETISGTKANQLSLNDVLIFETEKGYKGIAKVTSLSSGIDGSIGLDLKIVY